MQLDEVKACLSIVQHVQCTVFNSDLFVALIDALVDNNNRELVELARPLVQALCTAANEDDVPITDAPVSSPLLASCRTVAWGIFSFFAVFDTESGAENSSLLKCRCIAVRSPIFRSRCVALRKHDNGITFVYTRSYR